MNQTDNNINNINQTVENNTSNLKHSELKEDFTIKNPILLYLKYFVYIFILSLIAGFISSLIDGVLVVFFKLELKIVIEIIANILVYYIALKEIFIKEKQIPAKEKTWILLIIMFLEPIVLQIILEFLSYFSSRYIILYNSCINFIISILVSIGVINYTNYAINYTRNEKSKSSLLTVLNIFSCTMLGMLLVFGMYAKNNDLKIDNSIVEDKNNDENISDSIDSIDSIDSPINVIYAYLDSIEAQILISQISLSEELPEVITDVNYTEFDYKKPDSIHLNIDVENYKVSSGEIVYDGITYLYDGENVTKK